LKDTTYADIKATGGLTMNEVKEVALQLKNTWNIVCKDSEGKIKWEENKKNLIVDGGLNDLLDKYLKGSSYTASWFVGLKAAGTSVAADTMSSHSSWAELVGYSQSNRPALTLGTVASKSVDNSGSKATFSCNATATVAGAFLTTNNTKSGTSGTLYGVVDFGSTRSVISGDTLEVTVTLTAASA
tara:strand:+ start:1936 stop:2490 length:555 start_codon:yes stop_codon:yes gene_type:complete